MPRLLSALAVATLVLMTSHVVAADWDPQAAARYLDDRQKQWFEWKPAASVNGPCVSCHTGVTYLLARPALRRVLKEEQPTMYERGLLERLRSNVGAKPPGALQNVESILAAFFLARLDDSGVMSVHTQKAFEQLWALQQSDGPAKGAWTWYTAKLDPWEHAGSAYFGASLAALAVASTPAHYQSELATRERVAALTAYLGAFDQRPLHDRLAALWASSRYRGLPDAMRTAIINETFTRQEPDGGWSSQSLGPWTAHAESVLSTGSEAYATSFTAFVLRQAGVPASHPGLARALAWLESHQDPATGAWRAVSMNKRRPEGSMEALFMQDAATAFAVLALIEGSR